MIVARPANHCEPDLLSGHENLVLRFVDLDSDRVLMSIVPPTGGWSHAALESVSPPTATPWNALLGSLWIGSSEV